MEVFLGVRCDQGISGRGYIKHTRSTIRIVSLLSWGKSCDFCCGSDFVLLVAVFFRCESDFVPVVVFAANRVSFLLWLFCGETSFLLRLLLQRRLRSCCSFLL